MYRWSIGLLMIAVIAGIIGFGTGRGDAALTARIFFYIFIFLFIGSLFFKPGTDNTN